MADEFFISDPLNAGQAKYRKLREYGAALKIHFEAWSIGLAGGTNARQLFALRRQLNKRIAVLETYKGDAAMQTAARNYVTQTPPYDVDASITTVQNLMQTAVTTMEASAAGTPLVTGFDFRTFSPAQAAGLKADIDAIVTAFTE